MDLYAEVFQYKIFYLFNIQLYFSFIFLFNQYLLSS